MQRVRCERAKGKQVARQGCLAVLRELKPSDGTYVKLIVILELHLAHSGIDWHNAVGVLHGSSLVHLKVRPKHIHDLRHSYCLLHV